MFTIVTNTLRALTKSQFVQGFGQASQLDGVQHSGILGGWLHYRLPADIQI